MKTVATLQKKKINKGKLKKTIKNVLCRPDPVFWPLITDAQKQLVENALCKYRVKLPEFQKLLWKDLKTLPKEQRPKPPTIEKVDGLIFGISECKDKIQNEICSGILIEASVNPRTIVQPLIESCIDKRIPVVCIEGLRRITKCFFGIPTSCLGTKKNSVMEISNVIKELGSNKLPQKKTEPSIDEGIEMIDHKNTILMDTEECVTFEYLYRTNKKNRAFVPPSEETVMKEDRKFKGQDFIKFSCQTEQPEKHFKKMIVKRISSNPSRCKGKVK